jgi:hypothetical protein
VVVVAHTAIPPLERLKYEAHEIEEGVREKEKVYFSHSFGDSSP